MGILAAAGAACASACPPYEMVAGMGAAVPWWWVPIAPGGGGTTGCRREGDRVGIGFMTPILTPVTATLSEVAPWTSSLLNFCLSCSIDCYWELLLGWVISLGWSPSLPLDPPGHCDSMGDWLSSAYSAFPRWLAHKPLGSE